MQASERKKKSGLIKLRGILETGRFRIPYCVYGQKERTLILINGAQQSMGMWKSYIPVFINDFRVVVLDFPGQGRAEILSGPTVVTFQEQIGVLFDLVIATGSYQDLSLISVSWGSIIVMSFAEKYPHLVKKMILGSLGTKPNEHLKNLMKQTVECIDKGENAKIADLIIQGFGGKIPEALKHGIRSQFRNINDKHLETLREHIEFVDHVEDITKFINPENITTRTLVINGDEDTIIDIDDNKEFVEKMPNCEWRIAKNTGHFLAYENEAVIHLFTDFLNS